MKSSVGPLEYLIQTQILQYGMNVGMNPDDHQRMPALAELSSESHKNAQASHVNDFQIFHMKRQALLSFATC
jgi:hypothetical protein